MRMIRFVAKDGTRCAVRFDEIVAVAEEDGHATITLVSLPGSPVGTDWEFDALVSELEKDQDD